MPWENRGIFCYIPCLSKILQETILDTKVIHQLQFQKHTTTLPSWTPTKCLEFGPLNGTAIPFFFYPQFEQNLFHKAPLGKCGLKKVYPNKDGKPQPVDVYVNGQYNTNNYKSPGNCPNISVDHNTIFKGY
tara:strand:- start:12002 stop:12394 length:393 start_codon:yes stop_codon:yes gene_type:complete